MLVVQLKWQTIRLQKWQTFVKLQAHTTIAQHYTTQRNTITQQTLSNWKLTQQSAFFLLLLLQSFSHRIVSHKTFSSPKLCGQAVIHSSFVVCLEIHSIHLRHNPLTPPLTPLLGCPWTTNACRFTFCTAASILHTLTLSRFFILLVLTQKNSTNRPFWPNLLT